jgi:transcription antitermination factor NusG
MTDASWYALWVKSRHEFVTAGELGRKGIETFLPSVSRVRQWKDRKKLVDFPLFPGYLFVRIGPGPKEFLNVVNTRGSVTLVSLEPGVPAAVPPEEIESLKLLVGGKAPIDLYPALQEGTLVRIRRGPLKGALGVLAKREDEHRFVVNIELLGRSVGTRIYAEDVEAA